ncbi:MAG: sulfite exporter TauE/SafE family protein [Egibacteraceae bacterium]
MTRLLLLGAVGLAAQLVDGALGMAYGVTSSTLLLIVGVSPAAASASVHLSEIATTAASGASHWRFGNVDWSTVRRIALPGAVGAFGGAVLLSSIDGEVAKPWMAGILLALGVYILARFSFTKMAVPTTTTALRKRFLAPLGIFAGFVDAIGGGGWGPVATPSLLVSGRMEPRKVVGSVDTSEFVVALAASVGFLLSLGREGVQTPIVIALLVGGIIAAPLAAYIVRHIAPRTLGAAVGGMIILSNARTVLLALAVPGPARAVVYAVTAVIWAVAVAAALREAGGDRQTVETAVPGRPVPVEG